MGKLQYNIGSQAHSLIIEELRGIKWSNPQILKLLPPNMTMLLKCISGAAEV